MEDNACTEQEFIFTGKLTYKMMYPNTLTLIKTLESTPKLDDKFDSIKVINRNPVTGEELCSFLVYGMNSEVVPLML